MMYITTKKNGDSVLVSEETKQELIKLGKKTEQDFQEYNEELQSSEDSARKQADAERLRAEGADLMEKANELSVNPQMQPEQIGGYADAAGVGLARFMYPQASRIAEKGASESDITKTALIESPNIVASSISPSMSVKNALALGGVGAGTSYASKKVSGDETDNTEMAISGVAPFLPTVGGTVASRLGKTAKEIAPNVLHSTVVPKSGVMKGANPPDFEFALKQGDLIPKKGTVAEQIGGFEENIKGKVKKIAGEREALPSWKDSKVNVINGVFSSAMDSPTLARMDVSEARAVKKAIIDLRNEYADQWGTKWKSVEDAMNERSKLNETSKVFSTDAESMSAKKKAKAIIAQEIGNYVGNIAPEVMEKTAEMAPYMGLLRPVENASDLTRSKTLIPLGMTQAIMSGAMAGGPVGAVLGLGAHQMAKTPYGAQRLYNVGEYLQGSFPKTARASRTVSGQIGRLDYGEE